MADERGFAIDMAAYRRAMEEAGVQPVAAVDRSTDIYGPVAGVLNAIPNALIGRGALDAAAANRRLEADLRGVGELVIGPEDLINTGRRVLAGSGDLIDYGMLGLSVLPLPAPVRRGLGRLGRRAADTRFGRAMLDTNGTVYEPEDVADIVQAMYDSGASRAEVDAYMGALGTAYSDPAEATRSFMIRDAQSALAARPTAQDMSPAPSTNIGLVVEPDMSGTGRRELLSPDEARQQLADLGVNIRRDQVRASMTEPTLVAELDRPLSPEEAFAVSSNLRQKAIAHVGPEGGALSGPLSAEWGTFNPEYYMPFAETYENAPLVTDPLSARLVYEAQVARRQLQERALAEAQMRPVEGRSAGLNALNARNAEPYLAQLPPEEALRRRLSGLGIDVDAMDADWARGLAVERLRDAPANPTGALGVHYSRVPDLTQTDPSFYGTGHRGEDYRPTRARGGENRTHFYVSADGSPVVPEPEVERIAPYRYEADLEGMYDLDADPDMLAALARAYQGRDIMTGAPFKPTVPLYMYEGQGVESGSAIPAIERLIRQYGYSGYLADHSGQRAAAMFEPVNVRQR